MDTGSYLKSAQCQPCKLCYNQQEPLFRPSTSPSSQSVLCNSKTCQSLQFATKIYEYVGATNQFETCKCQYIQFATGIQFPACVCVCVLMVLPNFDFRV